MDGEQKVESDRFVTLIVDKMTVLRDKVVLESTSPHGGLVVQGILADSQSRTLGTRIVLSQGPFYLPLSLFGTEPAALENVTLKSAQDLFLRILANTDIKPFIQPIGPPVQGRKMKIRKMIAEQEAIKRKKIFIPTYDVFKPLREPGPLAKGPDPIPEIDDKEEE